MQDLGIELLMNQKKRSPGSVASMSMSHHSGAELSEAALSTLDAVVPPKGNSHSHKKNHRHHRAPSSSVSSRSHNHSHGGRNGQGHGHGSNRSNARSHSSVSDSMSDSGSYTSSSSGSYSSYSGGSSSGSSSSNSSRNRYGGGPRMTQDDIINQKRELLYQFDRLERKGVQLPRKFTLASGLDEMKAEYERIKKERELDVSVKFYRRMIMTIVTGVEFANNKFDIFGAQLDGWSDSVHDELPDMDEILEDLSEKYKGKSNMPPELRLMFALGGSAFMFHLKKSVLNSQLPGMAQMMQPQAGNVQQQPQRNGGGGLGGGLGGLMGGLMGSLGSLGSLFGGGAPAPMPAHDAPRQPMRGPGNVDDILRELNQQDASGGGFDQRVEMLSTISESEISDIPDDVSINNVLQNKRKAAAAQQRRTLNLT